MSKYKWTKEKIHRLINIFENIPLLWDTSQEDFTNRQKRCSAIEQISQKLNTDTGEINRKLHNLRTQFNNEIRKLRKRKSRLRSDEICTSKWEYFEALKFLKPSLKFTKESNFHEPSENHQKSREQREARKQKRKQANDAARAARGTQVEVLQESGPPHSAVPTSNLPEKESNADKSIEKSAKNPLKDTPKTRLRVCKIQKEDQALEKALEILNQTKSPDDDAQVFGNFVASAIRNIRSEEYRRRLKRTIQTAILEIEELDETFGSTFPL